MSFNSSIVDHFKSEYRFNPLKSGQCPSIELSMTEANGGNVSIPLSRVNVLQYKEVKDVTIGSLVVSIPLSRVNVLQ